ncbi:MAG: hypothetical protein ACREIS_00810 [Nitrospiraceae bacterium]
MNRDYDLEEIRHRARLLKARGKLARVPTSAIIEAVRADGGGPMLYADHLAAGLARALPNRERHTDSATEED